MAENITLLEFLEQAGAQVRAYAIGRRIPAITRDAFLAFEHAAVPA